MAQTNLKQPLNQSFNAGGSHLRSLSQSTFFSNNCLPPLSPFPPSDSSFTPSNLNLRNELMEETDVSSRGPAVGQPSPRGNPFHGNNGLPPRIGHRRSNSDVPLGFSAIIQSSPQLVPISSHGILSITGYMGENSGNDKPIGLKRREMDTVSYGKNRVEGIGCRKSDGEVVDELFDSVMDLDHSDGLSSFGGEDKDKDTITTGTKISGGDGSNSESETVSRHCTSSNERVKRSAPGDISPQFRHHRSLSMDSGFGNFQFGESSPKLQSNRVVQPAPSNSWNEKSAMINLDFAEGEFSEFELKKIMADESLAEIAVSDPKRAKRILANRQSAARSKERKLRYISELEHKVQTLQTEATTLSAQITILQKDHGELTNQNNELKFRIQAMEQQAQLRDALHETLTAEVQRLKLANMELKEEGRTSNGVAQQLHMKHHMFPMQRQQLNQIQNLSVTTSQAASTASTAPASA
ncbi:transcription factor RF2b [Sesamum indicum]|uniref:Transcription factor RF2b n=1 Tax=Sesamum indicum TaxID=4182 RepID=A0A6I9SYE8_SESIN|nr:transcription factor RF2b [Sesamum indicum]